MAGRRGVVFGASIVYDGVGFGDEVSGSVMMILRIMNR